MSYGVSCDSLTAVIPVIICIREVELVRLVQHENGKQVHRCDVQLLANALHRMYQCIWLVHWIAAEEGVIQLPQSGDVYPRRLNDHKELHIMFCGSPSSFI